MKKVSIAQAKKRLNALIAELKEGSPVLIVDRGRPVARLEAVSRNTKRDDDDRVARLVRKGIVRPGRRALPRSFFTEPLPRIERGGSVVAALLEERREGR